MATANTFIPGEPAPPTPVGDRNFTTVWILSLILGTFGIDRFYLGKVGTGVLKLLTLGGVGIWYLIDLILILTGGARDKKGMALANEPSSKKTQWIISAAVVAFFLLISAINNATGGLQTTSAPAEKPIVETTSAAPAATKTATPTPTVEEEVVEPPAPAAPTETLSQRNAKATAQDYLDFSSFSRSGLIGQLEYEGFSTDDATYAVDAISPDWNQQAAQTAADYLEYSSFSRQGLLDQLLYEGFTPSEAEYGVTAVGY
jgi:TM2 domain-containing membrane protein YozV